MSTGMSLRNAVVFVAVANVAIILAGWITFAVASGWPDIIVGVGIAALNIGAAREAWIAARKEAGPAA